MLTLWNSYFLSDVDAWREHFFRRDGNGSNWNELFYMSAFCCLPRIVRKTMDVEILRYLDSPDVDMMSVQGWNSTLKPITRSVSGHWRSADVDDSDSRPTYM